jgi:probable HAF family extracellular repeat protein
MDHDFDLRNRQRRPKGVLAVQTLEPADALARSCKSVGLRHSAQRCSNASRLALLLIASIPLAACREATAPAPQARASIQSLTSPGGQYQIIDLGTLPGFVESYARGINDADQVVGWSVTSSGVQHAFLWQNGVMTDLGNLGSDQYSIAYGINNLGQVVGWSGTTSTLLPIHAFLWENGAMTDLGTIEGPTRQSQAYDINDNGQVVGWSDVFHDVDGATHVQVHAALWQNGAWADLTPVTDDCGAEARAINSFGQVAGFKTICAAINYSTGFLWSNGTLTDLGTLGGLFSPANGINDAGEVVGFSTLVSNQSSRGFVWQNGTMTNLGSATDKAYDIANDGEVVGTGSSGTPYVLRNGVLVDLGTLGGASGNAWRINETGDIVGETQTALGAYHATLWRASISVSVMIEPSETPNSINTTQQGKIPVAILSTASFDAPSRIDHQSLTFGRTGDETSLASCAKRGEDVNGDGLPDLVCQFYAQKTGFQVGDTEGIVKGKTVDGIPIKGHDSVRIVK